MTLAELTVTELKTLIDFAVEQKLEELLGDPDMNLVLKDEIKERLRLSLEETRNGVPGVPIEEVVKKTGLRW